MLHIKVLMMSGSVILVRTHSYMLLSTVVKKRNDINPCVIKGFVTCSFALLIKYAKVIVQLILIALGGRHPLTLHGRTQVQFLATCILQVLKRQHFSLR